MLGRSLAPSASLHLAGTRLPFILMEVRRLLLVLLFPAALAGTAAGPVSLQPLQPGILSTENVVSSPRQSIPAPVHDESICAFCQAAAFAPHSSSGACALSVAVASEPQELRSNSHRPSDVGSSRPPRSRAPPTPRDG